MLCNNRPGDGKESGATRLARKLRLRSDVEESKVASNKMMRDTRCLIQDVDLSVEDVLGLFVVVFGNVAGGAGLDAVEARGQICWRVFGLGADTARSQASP
jgi:hypothetical protein